MHILCVCVCVGGCSEIDIQQRQWRSSKNAATDDDCTQSYKLYCKATGVWGRGRCKVLVELRTKRAPETAGPREGGKNGMGNSGR